MGFPFPLWRSCWHVPIFLRATQESRCLNKPGYPLIQSDLAQLGLFCIGEVAQLGNIPNSSYNLDTNSEARFLSEKLSRSEGPVVISVKNHLDYFS